MIIKHPLFAIPKDDLGLIRFMNLDKFEHLLITSSLYFVRADKLKTADSLEGTLTKKEFEFLKSRMFGPGFYKSLSNFKINDRRIKPVAIGRTAITGDRNLDLRNIRREFQRVYENRKQGLFINCWCISDHELNPMWKAYTETGKGVAIRTTFNKLKKALENSDKIIAKKISYCDFNDISAEIIKNPPIIFKGGIIALLIDMLFKKHRPYETEQELRLILMDEDYLSLYPNSPMMPDIDVSLHKNIKEFTLSNIDLITLVDEIILHPGATAEFMESMHKIITKDCKELLDRIVFSRIDSNPYIFE
jgi:hypothetical protein